MLHIKTQINGLSPCLKVVPCDGIADFANPIGALISTTGGLIASRNDRKSQERINQQNIEMQRETNAQNYKIWQEQLAGAYDMQQREMDYNSREAQLAREWNSEGEQVRRALHAGLNPFMSAGSIAGTQSGAASGGSGSVPAAPQMIAPRADMIAGHGERAVMMAQGIAGVINSLSDAAKKSTEKKQINKTLEKTLRMMDAQISKTENEAQNAFDTHDFYQSTKELELAYKNLRNKHEQADIDYIKAKKREVNQHVRNMIEEMRTTIKNRDLMDSTIHLNQYQITHLQNVDAQGWKNLEIMAQNAANGYLSAQAQMYAATHPSDTAAMLGQLACGLFGVKDLTELGTLVKEKLGFDLNDGDGLISNLTNKVYRGLWTWVFGDEVGNFIAEHPTIANPLGAMFGLPKAALKRFGFGHKGGAR